MSSNNTKVQPAGTDARSPQTGVAVEYQDSGGTVAGVVTVACGGFVGLTAAGVAAILGQAATYLVAAKVTAIAATGATVTIAATQKAVSYSCLPADAAAQITALQALVTSTNVVQTVQTVH